MKRLLAENGSIYVHLDWHVVHYVKVILDEIFNAEKFVNEIVRQKTMSRKAQTKGFGNLHDTILVYARTEDYEFTPQIDRRDEKTTKARFPEVELETGRRFVWDNFTQAGEGPPRRFGGKVIAPPPGKHWIWTQERIDEAWATGIIQFQGNMPRVKRYETEGVFAGDMWVGKQWVIHSQSQEALGFDTQKTETVLDRIIKASSNEGDLVADFFCGSGTTLAVAEKLNRKWVGCDFSKVAIQITRNRLVSINAKPFLFENIGNYQRQMIYLHGGRIYEMQRIVLKLYGATPRKDFQDMGVREAEDGITELVYVSYPDRPVTAKKVEELAERADRLDGSGYRRLVILGWDYEYNYEEILKQRREASKETAKHFDQTFVKFDVEVVSKMIPPEVYDYLKKAKSEEELEPLRDKIFFHEKPYLRLASPEIEYSDSGNKAEVTLGIQRYVLFDIPIEKEKERAEVAEIAKSNFAAFIDYWAVDWDYDERAFKALSQAFRGFGKRAKTVPVKMKKELETGKEYTAAVRLIDIFGNDATATIRIDLRRNVKV
jgi:adenine-specific DNA-methyltransferase